jgi:DNA-binding NarL/FixJ family response regulator
MDNMVNNLSNPYSYRPLRVLLVEDSVMIRDLLMESLEEVPGVVCAGCCETECEAYETLSHQTFDILILDIELKQGNGISLLRRLEQMPDYANNIKIIFTNNVTDTYRRAGTQCGVRYFFDKAADFPELFSLLERLGASSCIE